MTLVISEATRVDLVRYFRVDAARVVVTPLAAGAHMRPASAGQIEAIRRRYRLPELYVLYVGSNKPHKNLIRLVESWAIVKRPAEARLVIAGHWDERYPEARLRAEELGRNGIIFAGPVAETDLPALYSGATVFVFPSLYEGFGLPVLEAMACGAPVVCADSSSLSEVAEDAAVLVNPHEIEDMARGLSSVLADKSQQHDLKARGLARAGQFTWQNTAARTLDAYERAVR